jgi:hypothetical protein
MFFVKRSFVRTKKHHMFRFVFGFLYRVCCAHQVKKCSCDGLQTGKQCSDAVMKITSGRKRHIVTCSVTGIGIVNKIETRMMVYRCKGMLEMLLFVFYKQKLIACP